jgi:hypothetical protein
LKSATGQITGIPTMPVTNFRFLVRVTDASKPVPQTATAALLLTIN